MDTTISISSILTLAGAITAIGTAWWTIRKLNKDFKREREIESAKILHNAKEEVSKLKIAFESKREITIQEINSRFNALQVRVENLEDSVAKDFAHIRETYNGEIKNLGSKIEDLRTEVRNSHGQIVQLLSKLIENRD